MARALRTRDLRQKVESVVTVVVSRVFILEETGPCTPPRQEILDPAVKLHAYAFLCTVKLLISSVVAIHQYATQSFFCTPE